MRTFSLADILSPAGEKEFLDRYWQRRTYHAAGRSPDYFSGLITPEEVEATLPPQAAPAPPLLYTIDSRRSAPEAPKELHDVFQDGSTIKVDHVHRRFPPLNVLCRGLEEFFHAIAGANLYLTPPHSQGFRVHSDFEDVIVLQISGEKHWEIWPPIHPLPLRGEITPVPADMPPPAEKITVKAGEALYCPRGFPHRAYTGDLTSLHITLGIHTTLWIDLMLASAKAMARRNPAFREALPAGFLNEGVLDEASARHLGDLFRILADGSGVDAGKAELGRELVRSQTMLRDSHFSVLCSLDGLDAASRLRKRLGTISFLEEAGNGVKLYFGLKTVTLPLKVLGAMRFIVSSAAFSVAEIPGLNAASQLVLARRLIKDGYLTFA